MQKTTLSCSLLLLLFGTLAASPVRTVADFRTPERWEVKAPAQVSVSFRPDGLLRLDWKKADKPSVVELNLKEPVPVQPEAQRAGLKLFVETPMDRNKLSLVFTDREGTRFTYPLPELEKWARNWRYIDTYAFDANEMGRMHPLVGKADKPGSPLPVRPLKFAGVRIEAPADAAGSWLLDEVRSDAYRLGSATDHWALNLPGERYWMTTALIQSGVAPYLPADWMNMDDGAVRLNWELVRGEQGPAIRCGEALLDFTPGDYRARERKIDLGELPAGSYTVVASLVPQDLSKSGPADWNKLVWRADGEAVWGQESGVGGSRSFIGRKKSGQGYAGWRLTRRIPQPGSGVFRASARGDGAPEAWVVPLGRDRNSIGPSIPLRFKSSADWQTLEAPVALPPETDQVYVYLMAMKPGEAEFDNVELNLGGQNVLPNGNAEKGAVLKQLRMPLFVIASTSQLPPYPRFASTVKPGGTLTIPLPDWNERSGGRVWEITGPDGKVIDSGRLDGRELKWQAPHQPGVYRFAAILKNGDLELDRKELQLGVQGTLPAKPLTRQGEGEIPAEADLFGPGKNYFTWAVYENHPDEPDHLERIKAWVADGRKAGFDLFRIRLDWNWIEPRPGVYDFTLVDRAFDEVIRQGGKAILELRYEAPAWLDFDPQLDGYGRADIWRSNKVGRIPAIQTPGMLDAIRSFTRVAAGRYRDNPGIAGYHIWGLPGSLDWTNLDRPWLGKQVDFSATALEAFHRRYKDKVPGIPRSSDDFSRPDLSETWRCWVEFRRTALEDYMIDYVVKPLRELDKRRSIVCYFGLDFASPRLAESARKDRWRRHSGGCALYYQMQVYGRRSVSDTGYSFPQEVHLMTPVPAELEQATFQITSAGGDGLHWNYYWRDTIRTGQWTPDRNAGLEEFRKLWRPLWRELRDAAPAEPSDIAVLSAWSTMQYLERSFFTMRQDDFVTRLAAALYRDQLWPDWFSENAPGTVLDGKKLLIVPASGGQVLPQATAELIRKFVQDGGKVLLFPDSGRWIVEEPEREFGLLRRLGWQGADPAPLSRVETENGNSGFSAMHPAAAELLFSTAPFAALKKLRVNNPAPVAQAPAGTEVLGKFPDGSAAALRWNYGRGEVLFIAGHPDWARVPGFLRTVAEWAGSSRAAGTDTPSVMVNHLVKGEVHYAIVHRLPDSFRPHAPKLDREELARQPELSAKWHIRGLPAGNWRIEELTAPGTSPAIRSASEIASGLVTPFRLCQTRVYRLTRQ